MQFKIKTRCRTLLADLQTPVSIYLKVRDIFPESALLESTDFHVVDNRYSFIAVKPMAKFTAEKGVVTEQYPDGSKKSIELDGENSLPALLDNFVKQFDVDATGNNTGINGFFGYTGYDAVKYFEAVDIKKAAAANGDVPEMVYIFYKYIIVVNHFKNELTIVENMTEQVKASSKSWWACSTTGISRFIPLPQKVKLLRQSPTMNICKWWIKGSSIVVAAMFFRLCFPAALLSRIRETTSMSIAR
jgi:anthranilate/para-aminobenzoate synthase component I